MRSRQAPIRYGHSQENESQQPESENTNPPSSQSEEVESSEPEYSHSSSTHTLPHMVGTETPSPGHTPRVTPAISSNSDTLPPSAPSPNGSINLSSMRELLRFHEQDIVDRVVLRLSSHQIPTPAAAQANPRPYLPQSPARETQPPLPNPTLTRISELEAQLAELRQVHEGAEQLVHAERRGLGTYISHPPVMELGGESASGMAESVEILCPGVERSTLIQIIENRFKPTNIYRLLATEKDRAESQRTINIGGVEFEQAERDGKEGEYRMTSFFKAWAAYTGIFIKLAPHMLQGELATALSIYTMNLYDLLEKYSWEGVRSYHFQFHRKRVASGKNIYQPTEWRVLDSELVASKCFAHPTPRLSWTAGYKAAPLATRRITELPHREIASRPAFTFTGTAPAPTYGTLEHRTNQNQPAGSNSTMSLAVTGTAQSNGQACRNWNFRECRSSHCRYQHVCILCGSGHQASYCPLANNGQPQVLRGGPHRC